MRPTILAVLSALAAFAPARAPAQTEPGRWDEIHAGLLSEPVSTCVGCHEEAARLHAAHPVDVTYAPDASGMLRPRAEVERRGVALPDGKVHCWSCHSASSRWRFHLFLPQATTARRRVIPGVESTYEDQQGDVLVDGSDVSPKPLCLACHAFD
ncbi:conserved hypothetical protein [Anaeromyxobacter dehalogenans 2CP-1]|uniref:Uncharacterized protein n=1 Tax=Anaeromyxobacter dehalogenans (strain ATCC BAA-258 / DSM 21875 / 2CP-1) TaxID=455488 RepID=B8JBG2_ANAD2|nr:hypothetical protein [Anaeromyxobacter dehalogenans]ACL65789.1 conserved hypothetical protein [Anaeromyxobacter dehalogenans 2CP-1]